jgi:hypothetical protein
MLKRGRGVREGEARAPLPNTVGESGSSAVPGDHRELGSPLPEQRPAGNAAGTKPGKTRLSGHSLPTPDDKDSASTIWMRHYVINDCPICWVGDTAEQSHFCVKGQRLREAALAEFRAIPPPPKKRPADTSFNPSIESQGR